MVLLSSTACAPRRLHLDLKVGFIHCVLFHLQSIALMSPLVSQLISMDAPETSSHTFSVTFDGFSVSLLFSTKAKKKKKKWNLGPTFTLTGFVGLTFHVDLAVRDGPLAGTPQQVVHPSLRGTHGHLTDLFKESRLS